MESLLQSFRKMKEKSRRWIGKKMWQSSEKKTRKKNIEGAIFTKTFPWFLMTKSHRYIRCERKAELSHSHSWLLKERLQCFFIMTTDRPDKLWFSKLQVWEMEWKRARDPANYKPALALSVDSCWVHLLDEHPYQPANINDLWE